MICASTRRCALRAPCPGVLGSSIDVVFRHQRLVGGAVTLLEPLGVLLGNLQPVDDVGGDVPAGAEQ